MIIDVTGIELTPGNNGNDCQGNGRHFDQYGNLIEICCDECNYYLCCIDTTTAMCECCTDGDCPRSATKP